MTKHTTHITTAHQQVFAALTSNTFDNFAIFSCTVNGEPATAIVAVRQDGNGFTMQPLFVSVTPGMALADHDGLAPRTLNSGHASMLDTPHAGMLCGQHAIVLQRMSMLAVQTARMPATQHARHACM